jgi:hypothetical protein
MTVPQFTRELPLLHSSFFVGLAMNLVCVSILTRLIYYRHYQRSDLFLTFHAFNIVIFLIAYSLNGVEMTLGAAFGLFAVFSMLRYRTEDISARDMTYLFIVIALGLLMALGAGGIVELAVVGGTILAMAFVLEENWFVRREFAQELWYDRIDLVRAESRDAMIEDLRKRTGLNVHRLDIRQIDLLRDAARLTLYYYG